MKIKLHNLFPTVFFFFVSVTLITVLHPATCRPDDEPLISIEVAGETLEKTLNQVSEISGYTITLQSRQHDLPVTVHLLNVPLKQAILKILGNKINHAVIWDDKEKSISIIIAESSPDKKAYGGFSSWQEKLSGQGVRFEQMSRTTTY